jgi:hypothetical protein
MEIITSLIREFDKVLTNPNEHAVKVPSSPMSHVLLAELQEQAHESQSDG